MTEAYLDFDRHEREMWAGRASTYERSFAPLCAGVRDQVLDLAGVSGGKRLLDVGTGRGTLAAAAAGLGALVTAVDAEPSMVEAAGRNVPGAEVRVARLPDLPFEARSFEAVTANFVLNHVGDPAAAARELVRVTATGGRVAASIWPFPAPPLQAFWGEVVAGSGVVPPGGSPRVEEALDFPRTAAGLTTLLHDAGLDGVRVETVTWTHHFDPEDWWSGPAGGLSTLGTLLRSLPAESVTRIRASYDRAIDSRRDSNGRVGLSTTALLGSGTRLEHHTRASQVV
ncbi:class I SAM-dependent methyltransferase [Actinoplanes friuliensis]|uniref:Type 11 methyltransferase n=1 Tax=Actinoplanes friuliensis DSM 7358 TaxID=1246995 RepID=U5VT96_9ACTN|nr:class I SAM-dependent methyltransferase [Actinoplanes friuliensis]AGZ40054.1 type 11 methyltransferase [Actinoplanes friuliensis DSM 7358]